MLVIIVATILVAKVLVATVPEPYQSIKSRIILLKPGKKKQVFIKNLTCVHISVRQRGLKHHQKLVIKSLC
jgi:hypothetical protein